jgi:lysophospholipase L1-like esterase
MKCRFTTVALAAALGITSCGRDEGGPAMASGNAADAAIKVACVGDSITYGLGITDRAEQCYPALLGRLLGGGYRVRNFGVSGATMRRGGAYPYWDREEFADATRWNPDAVVIMLGTNDAARWDRRRGEEFAADCAAMLDRFGKLPSKPRLFVCLPPPVYAGREEMPNEAIPVLKRVAGERGVPVIDLDAPLRGKAGVFPDGVHPDAEGAAIMAREVHRALRDTVPPPRPGQTRADR